MNVRSICLLNDHYHFINSPALVPFFSPILVSSVSAFRIKTPVVTEKTHTQLCLHYKYASHNVAYAAFLRNKKSLGIESFVNSPLRFPISLDNLEESNQSSASGVSIHGEFVKHTVTEILSRASNQIMVSEDLMNVIVSFFSHIWFCHKMFFLR